MTGNSTIALRTGSKMPTLGLGTWELTDDTAGTIEYALKIGWPMIDTSSDYGTQKGVGQGIKRSGIARDKIYLVTKVEETDNAYERVKSNLSELDLDYADLMLIHRPPEHGAGEKLWEDLIRAKKEGLVRDIGVSNYTAELIDRLIGVTGEIPVVNQIEWTPFGHSDKMMKYCVDHNIVIQAYSSLTRGTKLDDPVLDDMAEKYGKTPAQILIRWNLQIGTVPISKANEKQHLEEDLNVFDFEIEEGDMRMLHGLNEKYSALGELPYTKDFPQEYQRPPAL